MLSNSTLIVPDKHVHPVCGRIIVVTMWFVSFANSGSVIFDGSFTRSTVGFSLLFSCKVACLAVCADMFVSSNPFVEHFDQ